MFWIFFLADLCYPDLTVLICRCYKRWKYTLASDIIRKLGRESCLRSQKPSSAVGPWRLRTLSHCWNAFNLATWSEYRFPAIFLCWNDKYRSRRWKIQWNITTSYWCSPITLLFHHTINRRYMLECQNFRKVLHRISRRFEGETIFPPSFLSFVLKLLVLCLIANNFSPSERLYLHQKQIFNIRVFFQ